MFLITKLMHSVWPQNTRLCTAAGLQRGIFLHYHWFRICAWNFDPLYLKNVENFDPRSLKRWEFWSVIPQKHCWSRSHAHGLWSQIPGLWSLIPPLKKLLIPDPIYLVTTLTVVDVPTLILAFLFVPLMFAGLHNQSPLYVRVVPLRLSPSCVTRKNCEKKS